MIGFDGPSRNVCYSGGARGADSEFSKCAYKAGHDVWHMSFRGHKHEARKGLYNNLLEGQLQAADPFLKQANQKLDRSIPTNEYTLNLLRRNYYQVKDVERVYAVAPIDTWGYLWGGTAWAVQMAIDIRVPEIYTFDLLSQRWYVHQNGLGDEPWKPIRKPPLPEGKYAGIGTREPTQVGCGVIRDLYK